MWYEVTRLPRRTSRERILECWPAWLGLVCSRAKRRAPPSRVPPIRGYERYLIRALSSAGQNGRRGARSPSHPPETPGDCRGRVIRYLPRLRNPVLVNRTFTKGPLRQRTRFFVAERRSSLLGRGALVLWQGAAFFLRPAARDRFWAIAPGGQVIRAPSAARGQPAFRRRRTGRESVVSNAKPSARPMRPSSVGDAS
jgi:hypothetical protein